MKVVMLSFYQPKGEEERKPGDVIDVDDSEGARLIKVGGARAQTAEEAEADAEAAAASAEFAAKQAEADAAAKAAAAAGGKK